MQLPISKPGKTGIDWKSYREICDKLFQSLWNDLGVALEK